MPKKILSVAIIIFCVLACLVIGIRDSIFGPYIVDRTQYSGNAVVNGLELQENLGFPDEEQLSLPEVLEELYDIKEESLELLEKSKANNEELMEYFPNDEKLQRILKEYDELLEEERSIMNNFF